MRKLAVFSLLISLATLAYVLLHRMNEDPQGMVAPAVIKGTEPAKPATETQVVDGQSSPWPDAGANAVAGVVHGTGRMPLPGADIRLLRMTSPWPRPAYVLLENASTGPDGRFRFRTARGPGQMVEVHRPPYAVLRQEAPAVDPRLEIQMRPGFAVRGRVEGPDGRAMPNCEVFLEPSPGSRRHTLATRTDMRGFFIFTQVLPGVVRLTARHPDFQPATLPTVTVGTMKPNAIRLRERALTLEGQVLTAGAGNPIPEAIVRVYPSTWNGGLFIPIETVADRDGRFLLSGLGSGNLQLEVRHPDHSTASPTMTLRASAQDRRIELYPRSRVRGQVVGVAGARAAGLVLRLATHGGEIVEATVDPDGAFLFPGRVSAGNASLSFSDHRFSVAGRGGAELSVKIAEDGETLLELPLADPSVVRGVVHDVSGRPVPGARIHALEQRLIPQGREEVVGVSDKQGGFSLRGLPMGATLFTFAREDGGRAVLEAVVPAPGEQLDLPPAVVADPAVVTGRVERNARGLPSAIVFVTRGQQVIDIGVTDRDGRFVLTELPPGQYRVRAHYSTLPVVHSDQMIEVAAGQRVEGVRLVFPRGREIRGEVVDTEDRPVRGVLVFVKGAYGTYTKVEDASGAFSLEVPDEDVELTVLHEEMETFASQTVRQGEDYVRIPIALPPRGVLSTRVLLLPGRRPAQQVLVRVQPLDLNAEVEDVVRRQRRIPGRVYELTGGELELHDFPAGSSRLTLHVEGHAPAVIDVNVPAPDKDSKSLPAVMTLPPVVLEQGASLRGRVLDPSGKAVAGARVHLGLEGDLELLGIQRRFQTDEQGEFELTGVSPAATTLVVSAPGFATKVKVLAIPEDLLRTDPLPVQLDEGHDLRVKVVGSDDQPREQVPVLLLRDGLLLANLVTGEDGMVTFRHRGPGRYEIAMPLHTQEFSTVDLPAGGQVQPLLLRVTGQNR